MAQLEIPDLDEYRRRTRTYDTPSSNMQAIFEALIASIPPAGTYVPTALSEEPPGNAWKLCNGQALSIEGYPRLYAIYGKTYGGTSTTFNLPDWSDRIGMGAGDIVALGDTAGAETVTLTRKEMPKHNHGVSDPGHTHNAKDRGHAHDLRIDSHTHEVTEVEGEEHTHEITDPGHTHRDRTAIGETDGADGTGAPLYDADGVTSLEVTGITIEKSTDPLSLSASEADVTGTASKAQADIQVHKAQTGIKTLDDGDGQPFSIIPPVFGVNWMVKT